MRCILIDIFFYGLKYKLKIILFYELSFNNFINLNVDNFL